MILKYFVMFLRINVAVLATSDLHPVYTEQKYPDCNPDRDPDNLCSM